MRIIHAHKYFYKKAGAERYLFDIINMQQKQGHQVIPFAMHHPKNLDSIWSSHFVSELITEAGTHGLAHAIKQAGRALWSIEAKRKFCALVDIVEPDIVHIHNIYTHISPSILQVCKERGIPVVMSVHDYALVSANYSLWGRGKPMNLDQFGWLATAKTRFIKGSFAKTCILDAIFTWQRMVKSYEKRIDRFFVNSNFTGSVLRRDGFNQKKIQTLYPFTQLPKKTIYCDNGFVLFIGRLEEYKGAHILLDAMRQFPHTTIKIAGSGAYEKTLRQQCRDMENVEFVGFVSGKQREELLSRARVCVVPSLWYEPFGLVAVEAMARKTPVIASNIGGLQEIVEPGVSGELFQPGDVNALVDILRPFIQDSQHAKSFAQAAHVRVCEISDPDNHYKKLMNVYEEICGL